MLFVLLEMMLFQNLKFDTFVNFKTFCAHFYLSDAFEIYNVCPLYNNNKYIIIKICISEV